MQLVRRPVNVSDFALPIAGGHYGFADFDYPMETGSQTRTYMVVGKHYMLLVASAVVFFKCRRRPA